jgi:large subunit ribosomal protein L10
MAKTKEQKKQEIEEINNLIDKSKGFLFLGFSGISVNKLNNFRSKVRNTNGEIKVIKRRILDICLNEKGIKLDIKPFMGQTALVFFGNDILDVAGIIYDFTKEDKIESKILGGYDIEAKEIYETEYLEKLGQLPSREVLLGQVVGGISGPIRAFIYTLKAIADKG